MNGFSGIDFFFFSKNRSKFPIDPLKTNDKLRTGSTQASVDLNNDLVAGSLILALLH